MAKSEKTYQYEHLLRANQYSGRLTRIYDSYVEELTKLVSGLKIDPDKPFSFADFPQTKERLNKTLSKIADEVKIAIDQATREEWEESNLKNDELVDYLFAKTGIPRERIEQFYNRNLEALEAFQGRKEGGLGLSDRVWKITDQYKGEVELGIDLALGDGRSAAQLSRDVRKYLKDPDNLFRRVRNKRGQLVLSKRAAAFHPGQGVYRSSYKNAMRLARTEVNMAYREADAARWNELPFVVGFEIKLSHKHPEPDICNDLAGKYPKTFKFVGWHPHCFCYCVSILATDEEINKLQQQILNGGDISRFKSKNEVTDVPGPFKEWVINNADRATGWKSTPYFIRDNFTDGDISKGLKTFSTPAPKGKTKFKTEAEKEAIRKQWHERRAIRRYGDRILRYMDGISDIDTGPLATLLKGGDVKAILSEAKALAAKGKEILGLKNIDNPMSVARQFSAAEAKAVDSAVEKTFARWRWDDDLASLKFLKGKLETEISFIESRQRYSTWKVAQDAYKKRLELVKFKIERAELADNISDALTFAKSSKAKAVKDLLAEWETLVRTDAPIAELRKTANKLESKYEDWIEKQLAKKAAKAGDIALDVENFINSPIGKRYGLTSADLEITKDGVVKVSNTGYMALSEYHKTTPLEYQWTRKYVRTGNSFALNGKLDDVGGKGVNASTRDHINPLGRDRYGDKMTSKDITDIKNFDKVIEARQMPFDVELVRMIDDGGLAGQFGLSGLSGQSLKDALDSMVGQTVTASRYLSFSTDIKKNVFTYRNVKWHTTGKKGTKCYFADNGGESEVVFGRGMQVTLKRVKYDPNSNRFEIWAELSE